jgi:hypothetical protein
VSDAASGAGGWPEAPGSATSAPGYGQAEPVSPAEADRRASEQGDAHPELLAAGAFVGGFVVAQVLKRVSGGG